MQQCLHKTRVLWLIWKTTTCSFLDSNGCKYIKHRRDFFCCCTLEKNKDVMTNLSSTWPFSLTTKFVALTTRFQKKKSNINKRSKPFVYISFFCLCLTMKLLFTLWTVLVAATTLTQALLQSSKGDDHWAKGNDTEAICNEFSLIGLDFAPVPGNCSQYVKCSLL